MHTKAQLIEIGKHYFNDKNVEVMYATLDGNFFYQASKTYADSHAKTNKIEVITITRAEVETKKKDKGAEKPAEEEEKKEEPTAEETPDGEVDEDALMVEYKEETGKNAIFRGKTTKGYLNWKSDK